MNRADGTIPGNWVLNATENNATKEGLETDAHDETTHKTFENLIKDALFNKFNPDVTSGGGKFTIPWTKFHFNRENLASGLIFSPLTRGEEMSSSAPVNRYVKGAGYYAFGDAIVSVEGIACSADRILWETIEVNATVKIKDNFTFEGYSYLKGNRFQPTAIGYRLQNSGHIWRFTTNGSWSYSKTFRYGKSLR
jgi:hypothetical protein